jgi:hypothetical protein
MEINKIIQDIEKDFSEGKNMMTLYGWKDLGELNEIKQKLEKNNYHCNISHETYIDKGSWPYQMIITKPVKLDN